MAKKKYAEETIKAIREMTTEKIPAAADQVTEIREYLSTQRAALNNLLIEFCLGCEITVGETETKNKVKFNHHLPSMSQIKEVVDLITVFIRDIENPMLARLAAGLTDTDTDDMGIPTEFNVKVGGEVQRVRMIDKPSAKKLKDEIFERDIMRCVKMDGGDILTLAALGSEVRKRRCRNQCLIIGGVALLLMGGVVTMAIIANNRKKHDDEPDVEVDVSDAPEVDMSDSDVPAIEDDVPQVEMEAIA